MNVKVYRIDVYPYHGIPIESKTNYAIEARDSKTNDILWSFCKVGDDMLEAIKEQLTAEWLLSQWRLTNPNIVSTKKVKTLSYDEIVSQETIKRQAYDIIKGLQ